MEIEGGYLLQADLTFTRLTPEVIDFVRGELGLPRPPPSASWDPSGRQTEFFERPFGARVRLTAEAMEDGKNRPGAFARAVAAEQARLMEDLARLQEPLMVRPRPVDTAGIGLIFKDIYELSVAEALSNPNALVDIFDLAAERSKQWAKNVTYAMGRQMVPMTWNDVERSDEPFWVGEPGKIIEYPTIPPATVTRVPPAVVQLTPARVYFDAD